MQFKGLIKQLSDEDLTSLMCFPGELSFIIKDVYDMKVKNSEQLRNSCLVITKNSFLSPNSKQTSRLSYRNFNENTREFLSDSKKRIINPLDAIESFIVKKMNSVELEENEESKYLNDYPKICKVVNPNPAAIIGYALRDLIVILNGYIGKGGLMFFAAAKSKEFNLIEKEAASLRKKNLFTKDNSSWLDDYSIKLSFFVNLYNFLVLFALCKSKSKTLPKTQIDWHNFLSNAAIKIDSFVISALEIEHGILRASMNIPNYVNLKNDTTLNFPKFLASDPRSKFCFTNPELLINFALSLPVK